MLNEIQIYIFFLYIDLPPPYPGYPHIKTSPGPLQSFGAFGDRKYSAPVLGTNDTRGLIYEEDHHIVRSDEIENIPETVQEEPVLEDFPPPMMRYENYHSTGMGAELK